MVLLCQLFKISHVISILDPRPINKTHEEFLSSDQAEINDSRYLTIKSCTKFMYSEVENEGHTTFLL